MNLVPVGLLLAEGKTKRIHIDPENPGMVLIRSKDVITAGDGVRRDVMTDKAEYSTQTTYNCLKLLESRGVQTHFVGQADPVTFRALRLEMLPIELVARRVAFGSYLGRNPCVGKGFAFERPVLEFFYKNDKLRDPLMVWNGRRNRFGLYQSKEPLSQGSYLGDLAKDALPVSVGLRMIVLLRDLLEKAFLILEEAWEKLGITLIDLKIECGFSFSGELMVGDVIDNDSWRICEGGDLTKLLDKQPFRDGTLTMASLKENYALVAGMTDRFFFAGRRV